MTRTALLFDIHGNLPALEAVLTAVDRDAPDVVHHGGDVVGWGPEPNEAVERLAERGITGVAGNHEHLALGTFTEEHPLRNASTAWTAEALNEASREWISGLPGRMELDGALLSHTNPAAWTDPPTAEGFPYVRESGDLMKLSPGFAQAPGGIIVTGHVHEPAVYVASLGGLALERREMSGAELVVSLAEDQSAFVVAGAVGKPRGCVPGANYVLTEGRTITLRRVSYDVARVAERIRRTGLPEVLAEEIMEGR